MYVAAHLGNLLGDGGIITLIGIYIFVLGLVQGPQKLRKICLQHKLIDRKRQDLRLVGHVKNAVENIEAGSLIVGDQTQDGGFQLKYTQKLLEAFSHAE